MFAKPIDVAVGEVVERDGFVFADVLPSPAAGRAIFVGGGGGGGMSPA
jgi:hypothetical protein